jgi:hypothetical protein
MHNSVTGTNFEAVDRVVRIVRELDRYHGFAAIPGRREESEPLHLPPPDESPITLGPTVDDKIRNWRQVIESVRLELAGLSDPSSLQMFARANDGHGQRPARARDGRLDCASLFPDGRCAARHHSERDRQEERGQQRSLQRKRWPGLRQQRRELPRIGRGWGRRRLSPDHNRQQGHDSLNQGDRGDDQGGGSLANHE